MRQMEVPSEIDTGSVEGLTRLFRFAVGARKNAKNHASLRRLESRFGLSPYVPVFRGALEDFVRQMDELEHSQRFTAVCDLISGALSDADKLGDELVAELLGKSCETPITRFSFTPAILPCLLHAREKLQRQGRTGGGETRYAGVGSDRDLVAFASLFLGLPVYTETNPPWDLDQVFDDGEPNFESPDLEIAFPPAKFNSDNAPHLEASVRASGLPRAVDRGKYDLESVMLAYLCEAEGAALAFTTVDFLASTKQSRLITRQHLLEMERVSQVTELSIPQRRLFALEISKTGDPNEVIRMVVTNVVKDLIHPPLGRSPFRPKMMVVSVNDIRSAGGSLKPSRYHAMGPIGGSNLRQRLGNVSRPPKHKLIDFFEVIRPKTTRKDPVGTLELHEVRAGNISRNGEIVGLLSRVAVRSTLEGGLEEQVIKPGDILFAHRGPIGRVAYVTEANAQGGKIWASQTLMIFRARKRSSNDRVTLYCDPRVLFMYLLTSDVQESWSKVATGDRSPAIPIGQIESFVLPGNLLFPEKPNRRIAEGNSASVSGCIDLILSEFQNRQNDLKILHEVQEGMNDGLARVWDAAWANPAGEDEH